MGTWNGKKTLLVLLCVAAGVLLFVPWPYYEEEVECKSCSKFALTCPPCEQPGWRWWGPVIYEMYELVISDLGGQRDSLRTEKMLSPETESLFVPITDGGGILPDKVMNEEEAQPDFEELTIEPSL